MRFACESPYPSGWTACYRVDVEDGEPRLGVDTDLECDCPRMVGLVWVPLTRGLAGDDVMVPTLLMPAQA
ncbi:hypothetical protein [Streptomyces sp. CB00455]|uniref:hypothetical protein n=1 Tax=Streptomyces sp. CB00455 TaxID=1703927 RepID=UPI000A95D440|nr:hypothetical protein [Streptomyces sp. CB00455]